MAGMALEASRLIQDINLKDHSDGAFLVGKDDALKGGFDGTKSVQDTASEDSKIGPLDLFDETRLQNLTDEELFDFCEYYLLNRNWKHMPENAKTPNMHPGTGWRMIEPEDDEERELLMIKPEDDVFVVKSSDDEGGDDEEGEVKSSDDMEEEGSYMTL